MLYMKVGVVGNGFVGKATSILRCDGIHVAAYDINPTMCNPVDTTLESLLDCDVIFISVPTPMNRDGSCYLGIVESAVQSVKNIGFTGHIVIRSTVPPGTSTRLGCYFMPEFLTEKNFYEDFRNNPDWIFGLLGDIDRDSSFMTAMRELMTVAKTYGNIKYDNTHFIKNEEAELVKLFRNNFLAVKVAFCNEMYQYCNKAGINYENVRTLACEDTRITHSHSKVPGPDGRTGYGGTCFPKDTASLCNIMKTSGTEPVLIQAAIHRNTTIDRCERDWEDDKGRAVV
mgnify:CR=1 FL=1